MASALEEKSAFQVKERLAVSEKVEASQGIIPQKLQRRPLPNPVMDWCNFKGTLKPVQFVFLRNIKIILPRNAQGLVRHTGGCHCGAVRFEVWSAADLHVFNCNCSICTKKQNHHFIVPKANFKLLQGAENLTTYTFNTHAAKHTFCKTCGVQSFYTPRSNPDGFGVAPHCLDPGTVQSVTVEDFCGKNWEESMQKHQTIRSMSKLIQETS